MNSYSTHQHLHQQFQKQIQSTDGHTNIDILTRSLSELDLMALKSNRNNNLGSDQINKQDRYTNQSINLNFDFDDSSCVPLLNKEILSHSNTSQFSSSTLFSNSDQSLADTYLNKSNSSSDPFLLQRKLRAQQSYFEAKHNEPQVYDHQPYQYLNDQPQKLSLFPIYHENHSSTRNTSSSTHSAQSPATDAQPFTAVTNFSASKQNHHQEHQALYPSELFYQNSQRSMSNIIQHQQQHLQQQQPLQQQQQQQPLQQQQQSPPMSYTCKLCSITGHWMKDCSLYIEKRPLYTHLHGFRSSFSNCSNNLLVPPQGYVCRKCAIPGHWIQHCQFKPASPPPTYVCRICNIKGHWIQQCQVGHANIDRLNSESLDRIHLDYERMQGESQRHVSTAYVIPELKMREPRTQQQARQQQYQQRSIDYQREHHFDNYTQQSMERDAQHNQHQEQQSYFLQSYTPLEYDMTSFY